MSTDLRLGRGLDALLGGPVAVQEPVTELALDALVPNPEQARKYFDESKLGELAESIKEQGIIQPILVAESGGGKYTIVAGERRWRAARLAGLDTVPVSVIQKDGNEKRVISLIENLQREDLNPVEEAMGICELMESCSLTQEQAAAKLGKSRSAVANSVRLMGLSDAAKNDLACGNLTAGHARGLLSLEDSAVQERLRQRIVDTGMTVRGVEDAVAFHKEQGRFPWEMAPTGEVAESGEVAEQPISKSPLRRKKNSTIIAAEKRLCDALKCKVKINGDQSKGKITLQYEDAEMLDDLLCALGAGSLEN